VSAQQTSQTITFNSLPDVNLGSGPVTLSATASSGLTVTYASTTMGVCTVSGTQATLVSGGACSITASQPGNSTYAAATPVTQAFQVIPPTITSTNLPADAVGAIYSYQLTASGGTAPYSSWTVSSGSLPPGLTLSSASGAISGTPTTAAGSPFLFSVTVNDNAGDVSAAQSLSIAIQAQRPVLSSLNPSSAVAGGPAFTLTATGTFFTSSCTINWNGTPISGSSFVSATQLTATVTAPQIATAGSVPVTVACGEAVSSSVAFPVIAPTGQTWRQLNPGGTVPTARFDQSGVFDSPTQQLLIFGGNSGSGLLNDLQSLSTGPSPVWNPVATLGNPPPARAGHSGTYDFIYSVMTIFGGQTGPNSCTNDVWTLQYANGIVTTPTWMQLSPTGNLPPARFYHSAAYDSSFGNLIVFGGADCTDFATYYNDLWILINANGQGTPVWVQISPLGTPPSPRAGASVVYDLFSNEMILFGGSGPSGPLNDVWVLSNANGYGGTPVWTQVATSGGPPAPRSQHTAVYSGTTNSMIVYGGNSNGTDLSDIWLLVGANATGGTPKWTQLTPAAGAAPAARSHHTSVFDSVAGRMIIFGGDATPLNDSWTLSRAATTNVLTITPLGLPPGAPGVSYTTTLKATGGVPPYVNWTVVNGSLPLGLMLNSSTGMISGTPVFPSGTPINFSVTVNDSVGKLSAPQPFSITIAVGSLSVSTGSLPNGIVGQLYQATTLTASGGSGNYYWTITGLPPGLAGNPAGVISGTPTVAGTYNVAVSILDTKTDSIGSAMLAIVVEGSLQVTTLSLPSGAVGTAYGPVTLTAAGGSGNYTWAVGGAPPGVTMAAYGVLSSGGAILQGASQGSFSLTVTVTDTVTNLSVSSTLPVTIYSTLSIATKTLPNGSVGQAYGPVTMAAAGGSGNYLWTVSGAPASVAMSPTGLLSSGSALTTAAAGSFSVTATATDIATNLSASSTYSITITAALTITTSVLPNGYAGSAYAVTMGAVGGSGHYSWTVSGAPPGVTMSTAGVLSSSAVFGSAATGTYPSVKVALTDTTSNVTVSQVYTIVIGFSQLTVSGSSNLGGFAPGAPVSAAYSAAGGQAPYSWSAQNLPAGLTLDSSAGSLSGSIAQPGYYSFRVQVADSELAAATASMSVTLSVLGISTTSLPPGAVNIAYSQTLGVIGGFPPCAWSLASGSLPAGLSLASATGVISGTPTAPASGTIPSSGIPSSFTVSAACGGATASQALTLTIMPSALPLSIPGGGGATPVPVTGGNVTIPYSQALAAQSGHPPYSWQVMGGNLPTGLSLNTSGTLSGTPSQAGSFAFTAQVTDTAGGTAASTFSVPIAPQPLTLNAGSFPMGIVGAPYPIQVLTANGGVPPYTFATGTPAKTSSGSLPGGLTLASAQISGTPTGPGVSSFEITVSDSSQPPLTATSSFEISIEPAHADLMLSQGSVAFTLNSPASGIPPAANITVESSAVQQLLNYSFSVTPTASWLDVAAGGTTPGTITVSLDPSAVSLPTGVNQTSIVVTCISPSPCAGSTQSIHVTLTVSAPPPQFALTNNLLSFSDPNSGSQPISQTTGLQNLGGGTITVFSATPADSFVTVSGIPATIPPGPAVPITVTVNPAGLTAGYYQSSVLVSTSAGTATLSVAFFLAQNAIMNLSPAGAQFTMQAGGAPGNPGGSFLVNVSGNSTVNFVASVQSAAKWLTLNTTTGSSTAGNPASISFTINSGAAALGPGTSYALIQVTSSGVADSPQNFVVVLNVTGSTEAAQPNPSPAGLLFLAGSSAPSPQTVQIFAGSATTLNYQAASDSSWLQVSPSTGTTSASSPAASSVSANAGSLAPGVYRGNVSYAFSAAVVQTVSVTLIVEAAAPCVPSQLVPTQTGLVNNFSQPVGWPAPLSVLLTDDCGNSISNAQVVASFSSGDPSLALTQTTSGTYATTWTPLNASGQAAVIAQAVAPGFSPATIQIAGQVTPNAAPILNPNGTLNAFAIAGEPGAPIAPGSIVQIYGSNLAPQPAQATAIPLPVNLSQTSVLIGGLLAPLYYVSPGQINAQVPFELITGQTYQVVVNANGALTMPNPIQLSAAAPGILQFAAGEIIAQHQNGSLVLENSPAQAGEYLVMYVAGMGQTNQNVPSGTASPSASLASSLNRPTVTLNGAPLTNVPYAGLTPTLVGLYQINFQVPPNAPSGHLQLTVTQTGGPTSATVLPVQ
jgi:uncharacterized protein (TIGR03437 family)